MDNKARFDTLILPAPVAQLDRATGYEPVGRAFESLRVHQVNDPAQRGVFYWVWVGGVLVAYPERFGRPSAFEKRRTGGEFSKA